MSAPRRARISSEPREDASSLRNKPRLERRDATGPHRRLDGAAAPAPRSEPAEGSRPGDPPKNRRTRTEVRSERASPPPPPRLSLRERLGRAWAIVRGPMVLGGRVALVLLSIAAAIALFRVIDRHVRTSPSFATSEIEIEGAARLSAAQIAQIAGIVRGENVFSVGPEEARARLLEHPWIAEAEVRRRLPGRWMIRVREHVATAAVVLDVPWLVSSEGRVFKRLEPGDPFDLPVVTGLDRDRFTSDRAFRARILEGLNTLLSDWRAAGLWRREPIAEIHVEEDDGLTLRIGDDATEVRLGTGPYRAKLDRLRRVLDELAEREARPAYVHLDNVRHPDRVVVRVR